MSTLDCRLLGWCVSLCVGVALLIMCSLVWLCLCEVGGGSWVDACGLWQVWWCLQAVCAVSVFSSACTGVTSSVELWSPTAWVLGTCFVLVVDYWGSDLLLGLGVRSALVPNE
jgi:hypothetical protein